MSTTCVDLLDSFVKFDQIFNNEYQESMDPSILMDVPCVFSIDECLGSYTIPREVTLGNFLQVNAKLDETKQEKLLKVLKE